MDEKTRRNILSNLEHAKKSGDYYNKFGDLWKSFNAWGFNETNLNKDSEMINKLKNNVKLLESFDSCLKDHREYRVILDRLKAACPVYDERYGDLEHYKSIDDIKNFGEVLEVIYQIRCNAFHGKKSPDENRDMLLVSLAYKALIKPYESTLANDGLTNNSP